MSPEKPEEKPLPAETAWAPPGRHSPLWRIALVMILAALVIGVAELRRAGYAVLLSSGVESTGGDNPVPVLRCTYFTGTEKVINHIFHGANDKRGKAKCPFFGRVILATDMGGGTPGGQPFAKP